LFFDSFLSLAGFYPNKRKCHLFVLFHYIVDFPGTCFASTKCATIEPGKSWELSPFCGRSTCVSADDNSGRLFELVEDCGPLPKANPKCKLSDKTNKTASFPECCPIFECEDGATLEYPDIPTLPPPTEDAAKAQPEAPKP
ncbi:uncharacterized protein LOC105428984, partial [Pogonomyrmex barbatus]|uniref:Uncharacterized protein LOC105428984 n=1 Tax=Pogonomyrmex barbatus TaxID=144034 RepID=A0A8N1S6H1_9HYME